MMKAGESKPYVGRGRGISTRFKELSLSGLCKPGSVGKAGLDPSSRLEQLPLPGLSRPASSIKYSSKSETFHRHDAQYKLASEPETSPIKGVSAETSPGKVESLPTTDDGAKSKSAVELKNHGNTTSFRSADKPLNLVLPKTKGIPPDTSPLPPKLERKTPCLGMHDLEKAQEKNATSPALHGTPPPAEVPLRLPGFGDTSSQPGSYPRSLGPADATPTSSKPSSSLAAPYVSEQPHSGQEGEAHDVEPEKGKGDVRSAVEHFQQEGKSSRGVLFLQQQLYQEDQPPQEYDSLTSVYQMRNRANSGASEFRRRRSSVTAFPFNEPPPSPNPLPWRYNYLGSPGPSGFSCHSPNFRKTPGASRPNFPFSNRISPTWSPRDSVSTSFVPLTNKSDSSWTECMEGDDVDGSEPPIQLMVANLDYNISAREWKKILYTEFQQHVQVMGVYIQTQPDNTNIGFVRVKTIDEARFAISQFHRKKIGYKRIHVSLVNQDNSSNTNLRCEVSALLKEVTGHMLPLFKFIEMFEKRYHRTVSVSELFRLKDLVEIAEQGGPGRMVTLIPSPSAEPSEKLEEESKEEAGLEAPICRTHCTERSPFYSEALESCSLPQVKMQLRSFAAQVHTLLQTHDGSMPLVSFPSCYVSEFGNLKTVSQGGVLLEHLVSCVPGVKVAVTPSGIKKVQWAENKPPACLEFGRPCPSPLMTQQLSQFSREVVDLLKSSQQCRVAFSKFIPSYHHHFGRQCRVADYGYTKLMELFEAIPHIVQILGCGSRRLVTLSHRAQVKRFQSDIMRMLKSQASKQIGVLDFPVVYNKVVGKPFCITEYGVCYIEDMLGELPESTVQVTGAGQEMVLAIPRREQTAGEMERTRQFAVEVVDLLQHSPQCRMPFSKFIPAYHHHFGKQCRVADYGFSKLIELFEAIPHVLWIEDSEEEKILCLTAGEHFAVLEGQVSSLLKASPNHQLPVPEFLTAFMRFHGHSLCLQDFGVASVVELINTIPEIAKVESNAGRLSIVLVDHSRRECLMQRLLLILMDQKDGSIQVKQLKELYEKTFAEELDIEEVIDQLGAAVKVSSNTDEGTVKLTLLQQFARDIRTLLHCHQGRIPLSQLEPAFAAYFGVALVPASYGYPCLTALLQAIPHVVTIRGRAFRRTVFLNQDYNESLPGMKPPKREPVCPSLSLPPCVDTSVPPPPCSQSLPPGAMMPGEGVVMMVGPQWPAWDTSSQCTTPPPQSPCLPSPHLTVQDLFSSMGQEGMEAAGGAVACTSPSYMHWQTPPFHFDPAPDLSTPPPCSNNQTMFFMAYGGNNSMQTWYPSPLTTPLPPGLVEVSSLPPGVIGLQPVIGTMYSRDPRMHIEEVGTNEGPPATAEASDMGTQQHQPQNQYQCQPPSQPEGIKSEGHVPSQELVSFADPVHSSSMGVMSSCQPTSTFSPPIMSPVTTNAPWSPSLADCPSYTDLYMGPNTGNLATAYTYNEEKGYEPAKYDYNNNFGGYRNDVNINGNFQCEALEASFKANLTPTPVCSMASCPPGFQPMSGSESGYVTPQSGFVTPRSLPSPVQPDMPYLMESSQYMGEGPQYCAGSQGVCHSSMPTSPNASIFMQPEVSKPEANLSSMKLESAGFTAETSLFLPNRGSLEVAGAQLKEFLATSKDALPSIATQNPMATATLKSRSYSDQTIGQGNLISDANQLSEVKNEPFLSHAQLPPSYGGMYTPYSCVSSPGFASVPQSAECLPHSNSSPQLNTSDRGDSDTPKRCRMAARFNSPVSSALSPTELTRFGD